MRSDVKIGMGFLVLVLLGLGWWYYNIYAGGGPGKPLAVNTAETPLPPEEPTATPVQVAQAALPTAVPTATPTAVPVEPVPTAVPVAATPVYAPVTPTAIPAVRPIEMLPSPTATAAPIMIPPVAAPPAAPLPAGVSEPIIHYSEPGETLAAIAARFVVPAEWVVKANPKLHESAALKAGTKVMVPDRPPAASPAVLPALVEHLAASAPAGSKTYTVATGDSLWVIAKKVYGAASETRVNKIKAANSKTLDRNDKLQPGMQLVIRAEKGGSVERACVERRAWSVEREKPK